MLTGNRYDEAAVNRLTKEALALDPIERLREASGNVFYVLDDFADEVGPDASAHLRHHLETTPVHEAGHAVAAVLAGRQLRDVYVYFFPQNGHLGMSRTVGPAKVELVELLEQIGVHGMAREVTSTFAGPAAELRFDARMVFSGLRKDYEDAEQICKFAEFEGIGMRFDWRDQAWAESCSMMQDDRVWGAVTEVSDRLKRSTAFKARVTGRKVEEIVRRHLPDGWDWQGIFRRPF
jgi:hypothetical protein